MGVLQHDRVAQPERITADGEAWASKPPFLTSPCLPSPRDLALGGFNSEKVKSLPSKILTMKKERFPFGPRLNYQNVPRSLWYQYLSVSPPLTVAIVTMAELIITISQPAIIVDTVHQLQIQHLFSKSFHSIRGSCQMQIMSVQISLVNMQVNFIY